MSDPTTGPSLLQSLPIGISLVALIASTVTGVVVYRLNAFIHEDRKEFEKEMDFQARWRKAVEPILIDLQYMRMFIGPVGQVEILQYDSLFPVFRLLHGDDRRATFRKLTNRYDVAIQTASREMTTDSPQLEFYTPEGQQLIEQAAKNLEDFLHNPDIDSVD